MSLSSLNLPPLSHPNGSPVRVLVVDDEPALADLVAMGCRMLGWDTRLAHRGREAVEIAREWTPDVLVLDWMLPEYDGPEVLERIRRTQPAVPALFLTAKDAVEDRIAGLAAGGDDYVTKPFSPSRRCCCACTGCWSARASPRAPPTSSCWAICPSTS